MARSETLCPRPVTLGPLTCGTFSRGFLRLGVGRKIVTQGRPAGRDAKAVRFTARTLRRPSLPASTSA